MSENPVEELLDANEHGKSEAKSEKHRAKASMIIVVLAVVSAIMGCVESELSSKSASEKNEALLMQGRSVDAWSYFEAKSIKKNMYELAALKAGDDASKLLDVARKNQEEASQQEQQAEAFEKASIEKIQAGDFYEQRYHQVAMGTTMVQIAIAIATIAIISGGWVWPLWISGLLALAGVSSALTAFGIMLAGS